MRRYFVTTFGCQMNAHDSERIKGMLESLGIGEAVEPTDADVLVFNTCTIREKPDTKLAAYLGDAAARKRRQPDPPSWPSAAATRRRSETGSSSATRSSTWRWGTGVDPAPRRLDPGRRVRGATRPLRLPRDVRGDAADASRAPFQRGRAAFQFDTIEDVLRDIAAGEIVIVTDDADRENEGDW